MEAISTATSPLLQPHNNVDRPKDPKYGTTISTHAVHSSSDSDVESLLSSSDPHPQITPAQEAKSLLKNSLPLCITYILQYSISFVTIFTVGHLGTNALGAASLATMTANITGYAVYEGLASSLDTLCAQAYGSGRKELVGLHLQRMVLLMLLSTIPIGVLWFHAGSILSKLVPEKELAQLAGHYLRILIFSTPGFAMFEAGKKYVQAQGLFHISFYVLLCIFPLNILFNYTLVFYFDFGLTGAVLATVLSNTCLPIFLFAFVYFRHHEALSCWPGISSSAVLKNWGPMIKLAIPGIIMIEAEWLAFDILTFSASYLSTAHLAAQSVVMTSCITMWHIPFSVCIVIGTRLGNLIGAGALRTARQATRTFVLVIGILGLVDATFIASMSHVIPRIFSDDPEVVRIAASVMPVVAVFQIFDASTQFVNSILRGLGGQTVGGFVNLFVYYCVAVPLALWLCFGPWGLELKGLWMGCVFGSGLISVVEGIYVKCADWKNAVERAKEREAQED